MKQKILKQLCMALCLFANTSAMAQFGDWKIVYRDECEKIGDFYYKLSTNGTAEVACPGLYYNVKTFQYSWWGDHFLGSKAIPETVSYEGKTYTVTGIGEKAFAGMGADRGGWRFYEPRLYLTIPNSVKYIAKEAFWRCYELKEVKIGNSVKSIGDRAFEHCVGLTKVTIPNSVETIGDRAFHNNLYMDNLYYPGLFYVSIGSGVKSIGKDAFYLNVAYREYIIPEVWCYCKTPPSADEESISFTFNPTADAVLYVPWGSVEAYRSKKPWSNFGRIEPFMVIDIDGIETLENDREETSKAAWYTIDGKKLAGEPTRKGVYIVNGKKVMK